MSGERRELRRLATLERKNGEEQIRWSWDVFAPPSGEPSRYVSVRKWFRDTDGAWRPTKAGATIRLNELDEVVTALQRVQRARDSKQPQGRKTTPAGSQLSPDELDELF